MSEMKKLIALFEEDHTSVTALSNESTSSMDGGVLVLVRGEESSEMVRISNVQFASIRSLLKNARDNRTGFPEEVEDILDSGKSVECAGVVDISSDKWGYYENWE